MLRVGTIKPEILEDEKPAGLSHGAWRQVVSVRLRETDNGNELPRAGGR